MIAPIRNATVVRACTLVASIATLVAVAGCSKAATPSKPSTPSPSGAGTSLPASSAPLVSTQPPSTTPAPALPASFNGNCGGLLPVSLVNVALHRPVVGKTAFIVGAAQPNIGRITYLNCKYGIPTAVKGKPAPVAGVEITASIYDTAAHAQSRVEGTIEDYLSNGAARTDLTNGQYPTVMLTGYGNPTVVAYFGQRTAAITVQLALIVGSKSTALAAIAKAVLDATASATGLSSAPAVVAPSGPTAVGSPAVS